MIAFSKIFANVKNIAILVLVALLFTLYECNKAQAEKIDVLQTNVTELTNTNSTVLEVTKGEVKDFIKADTKVQARLERAGIKTNRVTAVKNISVKSQDTTKTSREFVIDTSKSYAAVELDTTVVDSTKCFKITIRAHIQDNKLNLEVKAREFETEASSITYWERKKWSFLFIQSRFLGRKEYKTEIISDCGDINIKGVEVKKK